VEPQSFENVFVRSWQLLTRNWVIIVPGIVVGLIVGIVNDVVAPPQTYADPDAVSGVAVVTHGLASAVGTLIAGAVGIAGFVITQCYTVGMAGAAWARGTTTLGDGARALRADASNVLGAAIGLFILGVIAAALALPTLGISLVVYYLFMLYTIPSAVVGDHAGISAIKESIAITRAKFGTTLVIGLVLGAIALLGGAVALLFAFAPLLGPIVSAVISQLVVAFSSLIVVGEYLNLRGSTVPPSWTD
jgi:hypothetical protein